MPVSRSHCFFPWIERVSPKEQEAVIGSSFIVAASAGLLVLANDPHGEEALGDVLSGQILFIAWADVVAFLPVPFSYYVLPCRLQLCVCFTGPGTD